MASNNKQGDHDEHRGDVGADRGGVAGGDDGLDDVGRDDVSA